MIVILDPLEITIEDLKSVGLARDYSDGRFLHIANLRYNLILLVFW